MAHNVPTDDCQGHVSREDVVGAEPRSCWLPLDSELTAHDFEDLQCTPQPTAMQVQPHQVAEPAQPPSLPQSLSPPTSPGQFCQVHHLVWTRRARLYCYAPPMHQAGLVIGSNSIQSLMCITSESAEEEQQEAPELHFEVVELLPAQCFENPMVVHPVIVVSEMARNLQIVPQLSRFANLLCPGSRATQISLSHSSLGTFASSHSPSGSLLKVLWGHAEPSVACTPELVPLQHRPFRVFVLSPAASHAGMGSPRSWMARPRKLQRAFSDALRARSHKGLAHVLEEHLTISDGRPSKQICEIAQLTRDSVGPGEEPSLEGLGTAGTAPAAPASQRVSPDVFWNELVGGLRSGHCGRLRDGFKPAAAPFLSRAAGSELPLAQLRHHFCNVSTSHAKHLASAKIGLQCGDPSLQRSTTRCLARLGNMSSLPLPGCQLLQPCVARSGGVVSGRDDARTQLSRLRCGVANLQWFRARRTPRLGLPSLPLPGSKSLQSCAVGSRDFFSGRTSVHGFSLQQARVDVSNGAGVALVNVAVRRGHGTRTSGPLAHPRLIGRPAGASMNAGNVRSCAGLVASRGLLLVPAKDVLVRGSPLVSARAILGTRTAIWQDAAQLLASKVPTGSSVTFSNSTSQDGCGTRSRDTIVPPRSLGGVGSPVGLPAFRQRPLRTCIAGSTLEGFTRGSMQLNPRSSSTNGLMSHHMAGIRQTAVHLMASNVLRWRHEAVSEFHCSDNVAVSSRRGNAGGLLGRILVHEKQPKRSEVTAYRSFAARPQFYQSPAAPVHAGGFPSRALLGQKQFRRGDVTGGQSFVVRPQVDLAVQRNGLLMGWSSGAALARGMAPQRQAPLPPRLHTSGPRARTAPALPPRRGLVFQNRFTRPHIAASTALSRCTGNGMKISGLERVSVSKQAFKHVALSTMQHGWHGSSGFPVPGGVLFEPECRVQSCTWVWLSPRSLV